MTRIKRTNPARIGIKLALILLLLMLCLCGMVGCGEEEQTGVAVEETTAETTAEIKNYPPEPKDEYTNLLWSNEEAELYSKVTDAEENGENISLKLVFGDDSIMFEGSFVSSDGIEYYSVDLNGDGASEHIIIFPILAEENKSEEEMRVFDGKTHDEIPVQHPIEPLSSIVTFSSDEYNYYVDIEERKYEYPKSLFLSWGTENQLELPNYDCSNYDFKVEKSDTGIYNLMAECNISVTEDNSELLGNIALMYRISDGELIGSYYNYTVYNFDADNSSEWKMRAHDNTIVFVNHSTRYVYKDYSDEPDMKAFHIPDINTKQTVFENNGFSFGLNANDGHTMLCYTANRTDESEPVVKKAVLLDLETGEIFDRFEVTTEDMLEVTGVSADVLAPYIDDGVADYRINIECYGGVGIEFSILVNLAGSDNRLILSYSGTLDYTTMENSISNKNVWNNPYKEITSVDDLDIFNEDDEIKDIVRSFLTNDTETLEKYMHYPKGMLEPYKDLRFGDYRITDNPQGYALLVEVEITESSLDTIPPGSYELTFSHVYGGLGIDGLKNPKNVGNKITSKVTEFIGMWQNCACSLSFDRVNATEDLAQNHSEIVYFLCWYRDLGANTPERYKEEAKKVFNMDNLDVSVHLRDDGTVQPGGRGGPTYYYIVESEIVENGVITVRVQTYADYMYTIKSDLYEYKFEDMGDYLRAISCELVEKGEYRYGGVSV